MEVLIPKPDSWYSQAGPFGRMAKLIGPFHDSGDPWQSLDFNLSGYNQFSQGNRIEHENSVFHTKVDGKIYMIPGLRASKFVGRDSLSGLPLYEVRVRKKLDATTYNKWETITTSLSLILAGAERYGYTTTSQWPLHQAHYTTRTSHFTFASAIANTFAKGDWGDAWDCFTEGFTITRFDATSFYSREERVDHGDNNPKENRKFPGDYTLATGISKVSQWISSKKASKTTERWNFKFFLPEDDFSMNEIRSWMKTIVTPKLFDNLPSQDLESFGDLIMDATDNLDANSANMIAFVKDLRDVKSLIPKIKELGKLKTHASNYLAFEYGVLPTIDDLKTIFDAFKVVKYRDRSGFRRVSAYDDSYDLVDIYGSPSPIHHTRRIHVAVNDRDTGLDSLVEKARSIGVFPSLTNLWDLVPYSFVLDWFVDVGSVLERIDTRHRLINLDIPYVIESDKIEVHTLISDASIGLGASLTFSKYDRRVTESVPQPRIFGEINKPPTVQDHWIEGSALILQRTK